VPEADSSGLIVEPSNHSALPRTAILKKPTEFKRVFSKPVVSSDRCFKILARVNGLGYARLGMAVSRQVDKRAVGRNRIKRVIRESFRHYWKNEEMAGAIPEKKGTAEPETRPYFDVVVLPRKQCATICNRQLFRSLQGHWSRLEGQREGLTTDGKS